MAGGTITLQPKLGPQLTLIVLGPPDRSGGVGGWNAADRSGRTPGKWWQSVPDDALSIECALDLSVPGASIEARVVQLKSLGKPRPDNNNEPTPLRIAGDIHADDRPRWWVISDVKWGERLFLQGGNGLLERQHVALDFELYSPIGEISTATVGASRGKRGKRKRRVVVAHTHDTLRAIALRELGNPGRWNDLRKWNTRLRKTDPDSPLRRGTRITVR